jgi:cell division control protein 24
MLTSAGSYTCQIFWKGDPGIENFIIRFATEAEMKKWAMQVDAQRRVFKDAARTSASTTASKPSDTQFAYMRDQVLENPYREDDDDDGEEDIDAGPSSYPGDSYRHAHNSSSASIRSRSTTGDSATPMEGERSAPLRFPLNSSAQPPLSLRTQQLQGSGNQESYFSPTVETPMQTPMSTYSNARTSASSNGTFPFPRQQPPNNYSHEENNRYTAPAQSRNHLSRGESALHAQARSQRPSLPPNAMSSNGRLRAASSPDINSTLGPNRRANGPQPPVPEVPPFPTHYAYNAAIVNRSQNNSPLNSAPARAATQSPAIQRDRLIQQRTAAELANADYHGGSQRRDPSYAPPLSRTMTPASSFERSQGTLTPASMESRNTSPPLPQQESNIPTQLKVKVHCPSAGSTMVLVVSTNISFQSLKDRIDAKLQRSTSVSLGSGQVKLKYLDSENTYVSIQCDDDVQEAFENWKEQQRDMNPGGGQLGEIELFCQR